MNIRTLFIAALALIFMLSCDTKQRPIDQLTDLTEDLKANSQDYTEQEWQEVDKQLEQINIELEKYQYQLLLSAKTQKSIEILSAMPINRRCG